MNDWFCVHVTTIISCMLQLSMTYCQRMHASTSFVPPQKQLWVDHPYVIHESIVKSLFFTHLVVTQYIALLDHLFWEQPIYVCRSICLYLDVYMYVSIILCVYVYVCLYVCMDISVHVYTYVCMSSCMYVYMSVCVYIYIYIYMTVCVYIWCIRNYANIKTHKEMFPNIPFTPN